MANVKSSTELETVSFELLMATAKFKNNTRVKPLGYTKSNLTYGYTRGLPTENGQGKIEIDVYFPQIKSAGTWLIEDLQVF